MKTTNKMMSAFLLTALAMAAPGCAESPNDPADEAHDASDSSAAENEVPGKESPASISDEEEVFLETQIENLAVNELAGLRDRSDLEDPSAGDPLSEQGLGGEDMSDPFVSESPNDHGPHAKPAAIASSFNGCAASMTACLFGAALGPPLACGATVVAIATGNVPATATIGPTCYKMLFGVGALCTVAAGVCNSVVKPGDTLVPPQTRKLTAVDGGYSGPGETDKTLNCPGDERVKTINVWRQNTPGAYVTQLQAVCTDGTKLTFGSKAASDLAYTTACKLDKAQLVSGLRIRHGQWIDAVGTNCQRVGDVDANAGNTSDFPDTVYSLVGGSGGDLGTYECPAHTYVKGFEVQNRNVFGVGNVLDYIDVHCE